MPEPVGSSLSVVVTGGAGFIGSHVVDRLLAYGHRPLIYDARPPVHHAGVPFVQGRVEDRERLARALRGRDAVIHLAAATDVDQVEAAPVEAEQANARGTLLVLEAARQERVARVIYGSTIWVYSDTPAECHDESLPLLPPAHLYTASKLAGELYCRAYRELYGVSSTVLRFGIPYGPRARPAAVIPAFVACALAGQPLRIAGDGSQSRRFVYVEDLADGVVRALAPAAADRVYNLVGTQDVTILDVARAVQRVVGGVGIEHVPGRSGDYRGAPVSARRAAAELGWAPRTGLDEGIARYVKSLEVPAAVAPPSAPPRGAVVRRVLQRGALALGLAAAAAAMVIGLAVLAPLDRDVDPYDVFPATLVLLLPLLLAGGFAWDRADLRLLRRALWLGAAACVAVALLPGHDAVARLAHGHRLMLVLLAAVLAVSAKLPPHGPPVRIRPAAAGE